jgi:hypothetical protein
MWIRSQDKMELVPINSKLYIPISKTGEDFGIFHEETMLGHYKSKERALEVLNMIEDVLIARYRMDLCNNASSMFRGYGQDEIKKTIRKITIFEMPEK